MKKTLLLLTGLLFIGMVDAQTAATEAASPTSYTRGIAWRIIGDANVGKATESNVIVIKEPAPGLKKLKFAVRDYAISINKLVVTFDDGKTQTIDAGFSVPKNGESNIIEIDGAGKSITQVTFWYNNKDIVKGTAEVTVFARK